jgi:hypothetical protein
MSVLGCCETGVLAGDQLELDELAMLYASSNNPLVSRPTCPGQAVREQTGYSATTPSMMPLNQSVATRSMLAGRVGVQVVGAGEDLGGDTG